MTDVRNNKGVFVISLDFELFWGVWDVTNKENYSDHILGVREVIPRLLELFGRYGIKTTFATVGFLFAKNKAELLSFLPVTRPIYGDPSYNVYQHEFNSLGNDEKDDPYHFGYPLLQMIKESPHEMASHSFCHYYCLEEEQSAAEFDADISAATKIAAAKNIKLDSFVFPRNQVNQEYLPILKKNGINVYRGNPVSWIYKPRKFAAEVLPIRFLRLLDAYFPISGYNTHPRKTDRSLPVNIPASRFLKPYNRSLAWLEWLKLNRIKKEMTMAARSGELYHLWWHPHNFGVNLEQNIANLTELLEHYKMLQAKYGFSNLTMKEAAAVVTDI